MFWVTMCPSSGEITVFMRHLLQDYTRMHGEQNIKSGSEFYILTLRIN
jgi:hypothetical protein